MQNSASREESFKEHLNTPKLHTSSAIPTYAREHSAEQDTSCTAPSCAHAWHPKVLSYSLLLFLYCNSARPLGISHILLVLLSTKLCHGRKKSSRKLKLPPRAAAERSRGDGARTPADAEEEEDAWRTPLSSLLLRRPPCLGRHHPQATILLATSY